MLRIASMYDSRFWRRSAHLQFMRNPQMNRKNFFCFLYAFEDRIIFWMVTPTEIYALLDICYVPLVRALYYSAEFPGLLLHFRGMSTDLPLTELITSRIFFYLSTEVCFMWSCSHFLFCNTVRLRCIGYTLLRTEVTPSHGDVKQLMTSTAHLWVLCRHISTAICLPNYPQGLLWMARTGWWF